MDDPTVYEWAGGAEALTRMTRIFYGRHVPNDPLIGPLFADMAPDHPERVAAWLGEVFGGPKVYSERYGGYARMVGEHLGRALREEQRQRWVALLLRSADEAGLPTDPEFRAAFVSYIEWGSRIAVDNSQPGASPPLSMPVPRWTWVNDATPSFREAMLATISGGSEASGGEDEPVAEPPVAGEPVSFARNVRGLFRARDRNSMRRTFDLWDVDDVRESAAPILARLREGTMPCDGAWPAEQVDVFARWVEDGAAA